MYVALIYKVEDRLWTLVDIRMSYITTWIKRKVCAVRWLERYFIVRKSEKEAKRELCVDRNYVVAW